LKLRNHIEISSQKLSVHINEFWNSLHEIQQVKYVVAIANIYLHIWKEIHFPFENKLNQKLKLPINFFSLDLNNFDILQIKMVIRDCSLANKQYLYDKIWSKFYLIGFQTN
jgi:hypothetical protein